MYKDNSHKRRSLKLLSDMTSLFKQSYRGKGTHGRTPLKLLCVTAFSFSKSYRGKGTHGRTPLKLLSVTAFSSSKSYRGKGSRGRTFFQLLSVTAFSLRAAMILSIFSLTSVSFKVRSEAMNFRVNERDLKPRLNWLP
jgi:hypothetical protein